MEKIKSNSLLHIFLFSLLIVLSLSITTSFGKVLAEGATELNETTATIKVTANDETSYYESFSNAIENLPSNATITLLKDATFSSSRGLRCSIDLNGNTLSGGGIDAYTNTLTILDSKGTGKISGNIYFIESSYVTIKSAGLIEYFYFINSGCTVLGGKINRLALNIDNTKISGGEINNLIVYREGSIHLSGGTINNFNFVGIPENFNMLDEGYIYSNKADNTPIKTKDMTSSTNVTIIKCTHTAFTDCVCDYCGYMCEHSGHYNQDGVCQVCGYVCSHENHFNSNGVCDVCGYVCPHLELNSENVCLKCNQEMEAYLKDASTTKNYIRIADAVSSIKDGDTLTLYKNISLEDSLDVNAICTIDLNGYELNNYYVNLNNRIKVIDTAGNGYMGVASNSTSSQIELNGAETTIFFVMLNANRLKFHSGKIVMLHIYNGTIDDILPDGYIFIKHENTSSQKLTKQETNVGRFYNDNCYLTCEECTHDALDENLNCKYCGTTLSQDQIMQALLKELQATKEELSQAITQKEDITTINEKVKNLNDSISSTETICKAYSDEKDAELKTELQNLINNAKQEAISSSNTALELAKNNLLNMVNTKLDIETYNQKVLELTTAITNAENASKAYADNKDLELKNELINKINDSKTTLQNVNNELQERLSKAETQIDNNAKSINSLKIALIVISISFVVIVVAGFVVLYLYIKKRHIR